MRDASGRYKAGMRVLGLILCGLLLTACTTPGADEPPEPTALTADTVFGDFRTIDYCSMLDPAGGTPASSFEQCRVDVAGTHRIVGPVQSDDDSIQPYRYPGKLPSGVRIWQDPRRDRFGACLRWVGFSDHNWLLVGASRLDSGTATPEQLCTVADDMVARALTVIQQRKVGHVTYGKDSFGSLDPCALLDRPEVEAIVERGVPDPSPHGHDCDLGGTVGLGFRVVTPSTTGTLETVGGRQGRVEVIGAVCFVSVERPLPDRPGLVEEAKFTGVDMLGNGADACQDTRAVAAVVVPGLPQ
jgi:hypothetical protein